MDDRDLVKVAMNLGKTASGIEGTERLVKSYYEEWWENRRDIRNVVFERLNDKVRSMIGSAQNLRALDLGSGKGRIVSMLLNAGAEVTAIEYNETFALELRRRYPEVEVVCADLRTWEPKSEYDIATCIEVAQVLDQTELVGLLRRLRPFVRRLLINVSNSKSLHGTWVRVRRFQAPFIVSYHSRDLMKCLRGAGYTVTHTVGVGFITPISMFREFRVAIVGRRLSEGLQWLDDRFPQLCHLFMAEAVPDRS